MPAVASTDSAKPERGREAGLRRSSSTTTATPRARLPRCAAVRCPSRAARPSPSPRPAARSARCARAARTRRCRARRPTCSHRPRTPAQRASTSRNPTTSVRLVPETASRWVRPVVRKSAARSSVDARRRRRRPGPAPAPAARPGGGRPRRRSERRTASAPRHQAPGPARRSRRAARGAARPPGRRPGPARAARRRAPRSPSRTPDQPSSARTSTGAASAVGAPAAGDPVHREPDQHLVAVPARRPGAGRRSPWPRRATTAPSRGQRGHRVAARPAPGAARPRSAAAASTSRSAAAVGARRRRRRARGRATADGSEATGARTGSRRQQRPAAAGRRPARRARPPARAAASAGRAGRRRRGARASSRRGTASDRDMGGQLAQGRVTDAVDLEQLVDRGEAAVLGAPGDDRLRRSPGPTSGSVSSSAWDAVLRFTSGPAVAPAAGAADATSPGGVGTPTRICSPSTRDGRG